MKFNLRPFIDVDVRKRAEAVRFYRDVLGFEANRESSLFDAETHRVDMSNGLLTLGFVESPHGHVTFEFQVENLAAAKAHLANEGCEFMDSAEGNVTTLVKDPFGNYFRLVQM